ncbi:uncharacterized protein L969DRAFT_83068 [Mixia osmundae IAM 14324]|uniref:uncharacterized protein n=1 Tax=Mixia osmundae (strain CBS 9802 / IAM 14324 / JCM 22182 / KY 12970) TaxID=764103 RepID=UPI0004A55678|nr:uncharacterized protein L969DRAFT_83068 [Mixia osmundae IAM 14324]KEI37780.1 hypothetical protein L969DRAFT_83068 [Mixia osmundae IAM 14324]
MSISKSLLAGALLVSASLAAPSPSQGAAGSSIQLNGVVRYTTPERAASAQNETGLNFGDSARLRARMQMNQGQDNFVHSFAAGQVIGTNKINEVLIPVGIGADGDVKLLILDSGSSNTWAGSLQPVNKSSTTVSTGKKVSLSYGTGAMQGDLVNDQITIGPMVIKNQGITIATQTRDFQDADGIAGIGGVALTSRTIVGAPQETIPTLMDNLLSQGIISQPYLSVAMQPGNKVDAQNTRVTFGAIDNDSFVGELNFVPITKAPQAGRFWGVDLSVAVGTARVCNNAPVIKAVGGKVDARSGLLAVKRSALQSLALTFGKSTYTLSAEAQVFPSELNSMLGVLPTGFDAWGIMGSLGTPSGSGLDGIIGQSVLQRLFVVFDSGMPPRVGFANTRLTQGGTNNDVALTLPQQSAQTSALQQSSAITSGASSNAVPGTSPLQASAGVSQPDQTGANASVGATAQVTGQQAPMQAPPSGTASTQGAQTDVASSIANAFGSIFKSSAPRNTGEAAQSVQAAALLLGTTALAFLL